MMKENASIYDDDEDRLEEAFQQLEANMSQAPEADPPGPKGPWSNFLYPYIKYSFASSTKTLMVLNLQNV
jgi:hypothetical protein